MNAEHAIRRAQVYSFLTGACLYPDTNWLEDFPAAAAIAAELKLVECDPAILPETSLSLEKLQSEYRVTFGLAGSQCYETEIGLPHEFRQSQEMADIAGFYQAFGFRTGGAVRERPDHLAVELEFMSVLALKEALALAHGNTEQAEICLDAQRKFLVDHLACWVGLVSESLRRLNPNLSAEAARAKPYLELTRFCAEFTLADARRLGIHPQRRPPAEMAPTPFNPDFSCETCPAIEELG